MVHAMPSNQKRISNMRKSEFCGDTLLDSNFACEIFFWHLRHGKFGITKSITIPSMNAHSTQLSRHTRHTHMYSCVAAAKCNENEISFLH